MLATSLDDVSDNQLMTTTTTTPRGEKPDKEDTDAYKLLGK